MMSPLRFWPARATVSSGNRCLPKSGACLRDGQVSISEPPNMIGETSGCRPFQHFHAPTCFQSIAL